ncbi:MAG TPA: hypothetical protein VM557_11115 [Thermoanaerobaculia bacterium]|nr:hypothetical protein [Thermoanaerobaculia bacterium]
MAVYLDLFHGRDTIDEDLNDWGDHGPSLGPFDSIQTTYLDHIRPVIGGESPGDFRFRDGMLVWRGKYFGDWCVVSEPAFPVEPIEATLQYLASQL